MSMRSRIREYKEREENAVKEELSQLHERKAFGPMKVEDMSKDQKIEALEMLMFLLEKRDGSIKGRGCADGRKHSGFSPVTSQSYC